MPQYERNIWLWLTRAFEGLFGMYDRALADGVPVCPEVIVNLKNARDKIDSLIKRFENGSQ